MPVSLYNAIVPTWQRILNAGQGWLVKAEAFAQENGMSEADLLDARLIEDMLPFNYQVKSMGVHSRGAIEGARSGVFSPDMSTPPESFAALKQRLDETVAALEAVEESEVESWVGKPMAFVIGERRLEFVAEDFLLHFSQSNFHFHSTTAYAILRMRGVGVGKLDFMGQPPSSATRLWKCTKL
jgi:hypothetical protein